MIVCPWKDIKKYASLLPGRHLNVPNDFVKVVVKLKVV